MKKMDIIYRLKFGIGAILMLAIAFSVGKFLFGGENRQVVSSTTPKEEQVEICDIDFKIESFKRVTGKVLQIRNWNAQIEYPSNSVLKGLEFMKISDLEYVSEKNLYTVPFIDSEGNEFGLTKNPKATQGAELNCTSSKECAETEYKLRTNDPIYKEDNYYCVFELSINNKTFSGIKGQRIGTQSSSFSIFQIVGGTLFEINAGLNDGTDTSSLHKFLNFVISLKPLN